ncbi:alpha-glucosidase [compost metagenome]
MYGSDLLVAPIVEAHTTSRQVYLPHGANWTNACTGEAFKGGQWLEVLAPIDTLPVFLRDQKQGYLIGKV